MAKIKSSIEAKKQEASLSIKKITSENTEANSEKRIGSESNLSPPQLKLIKKYLTIARIKSKVMPKQIEIKEPTRLEVK